MISGVNLDTKSVTVEWYENGETKGKEVKKEWHTTLYFHWSKFSLYYKTSLIFTKFQFSDLDEKEDPYE